MFFSEDVYLTEKEVTQRFKISRTTIHRYRKQGILKPLGLGGKVLYRLSDIEDSLKEI